ANHCVWTANPPDRFSTWVGPTTDAGVPLVHPDDGTPWVASHHLLADYGPGLGTDGLTMLVFASEDRYPDDQGYPVVGWEYFSSADDGWQQLPVGQPLRIVGYGDFSDVFFDGRQRRGTPNYSTITGSPPTVRLNGDQQVCPGDSGGPLFMDHNPIKLIGTA